jgi:SAM-dependent methyltransferase
MTDYAAEYGRMHESDKRFPGYSLGAYVDAIAMLVANCAPVRMLDYGSGKGMQYLARRYHDKWGGLLPHCYDIGVKQLAAKPEGQFGGVICTDVMEHIEEADVPGILEELLGYVAPGGFLFLGISCRPTRKKLSDGRDVHVTIAPPAWWIGRINDAASAVKTRGIRLEAHWDVAGHFECDESPFKLVLM